MMTQRRSGGQQRGLRPHVSDESTISVPQLLEEEKNAPTAYCVTEMMYV